MHRIYRVNVKVFMDSVDDMIAGIRFDQTAVVANIRNGALRLLARGSAQQGTVVGPVFLRVDIKAGDLRPAGCYAICV